MTADDYNEKQIEDQKLTSSMITELVELFQEQAGLTVDGKCGPMTRQAIMASWSIPPEVSELSASALTVARSCLGKGEEGGNNSGEFVEMLHQKRFDGNDDDDGAWCAAFMSHCFERAAELIEQDMPFLRSGGAKRLYKNACASGRQIEAGQENVETSVLPGDLVCWHRGDPSSWTGHIGIVERVEPGVFWTIEGNVGRFPAKVRRFKHTFDESNLIGFARN